VLFSGVLPFVWRVEMRFLF